MKRLIYLGALLFAFVIPAVSQEIHKAPKQITAELGYRYVLKNDLLSDAAASGMSLMLDYGWQLSAFDGIGKPVYLTIPLGYTYFPGSSSATGMRMLSYGWSVRHMLTSGGRTSLFMGYGLLLNQLSVSDREGQMFGHQTRFEFGVNFLDKQPLSPFIKLEYSMSRHPQLDDPESYWFHAVELKTGVRFN